jgi:hypothetical protein
VERADHSDVAVDRVGALLRLAGFLAPYRMRGTLAILAVLGWRDAGIASLVALRPADLASVFIADPTVLLDDCTSALDAETESRVRPAPAALRPPGAPRSSSRTRRPSGTPT